MTSRAGLFRALGALCEAPATAARNLGTALALPGRPTDHDHAEVFLFQLYPFASVYLGAEGMLGGEARARVAGFWSALGFEPPPEPDHLAALLFLYAGLIDCELEEPEGARRALRRQSRKALLWEHLLSWVPVFSSRMREVAPPFYAEWAELLLEALIDETRTVGGEEKLPLHLREAPELPLPSEDPSSFLPGLLAPVRSGIVLTRSDLSRAARDLDLGLRMGERRLVLESLLAQDAGGTLWWLSQEASRSAERYASNVGRLGTIASFWRERAEAAATVLAG